MTLIKTASGNSRSFPSKFKCPECGSRLKIVKRFFMTTCPKCKKNIKGDDLIEVKDES